MLRLRGYEVVSVLGNEAAKVVLTLPHHCDLFIVGHAAPEESRKQMVSWLKTKFPGVRVLGLNPPRVRKLPGADYNVKLNGPKACCQWSRAPWVNVTKADLTRIGRAACFSY